MTERNEGSSDPSGLTGPPPAPPTGSITMSARKAALAAKVWVRRDYIEGRWETLRGLAQKYGVHPWQVYKWIRQEDWDADAKRYREKIQRQISGIDAQELQIASVVTGFLVEEIKEWKAKRPDPRTMNVTVKTLLMVQEYRRRAAGIDSREQVVSADDLALMIERVARGAAVGAAAGASGGAAGSASDKVITMPSVLTKTIGPIESVERIIESQPDGPEIPSTLSRDPEASLGAPAMDVIDVAAALKSERIIEDIKRGERAE